MKTDLSSTFNCGETHVCRADLESLPCPFCTENVDDETMQRLVDLVEADYQQTICEDMPDDRKSEIWWRILEKVCNYLNIPYYEDLPNNE